MKVRNYLVRWNYSPNKIRTTCIIADANNTGSSEEPIHETISRGECKKTCNDIYDKNKARMVSMSKALQGIPKSDRADIWESYRTLTKIPRWGKND